MHCPSSSLLHEHTRAYVVKVLGAISGSLGLSSEG